MKDLRKKSDEMNAETNHLRSFIETTKKKKNSWVAQTLHTLAMEGTEILSVPAKLVGKGLQFLSSLFD